MLLNEPYNLQLEFDLKDFEGGTFADLTYQVIHRMIKVGPGILRPLYKSLVSVLSNTAPYVKWLSKDSCECIFYLIKMFSNPELLKKREETSRILSNLFEAMNYILLYHDEGNEEFLIALIKYREVLKIGELKLAEQIEPKKENVKQLKEEQPKEEVKEEPKVEEKTQEEPKEEVGKTNETEGEGDKQEEEAQEKEEPKETEKKEDEEKKEEDNPKQSESEKSETKPDEDKKEETPEAAASEEQSSGDAQASSETPSEEKAETETKKEPEQEEAKEVPAESSEKAKIVETKASEEEKESTPKSDANAEDSEGMVDVPLDDIKHQENNAPPAGAHVQKAFLSAEWEEEWKKSLNLLNIKHAIQYTDDKARSFLAKNPSPDNNIDADKVRFSHLII